MQNWFWFCNLRLNAHPYNYYENLHFIVNVYGLVYDKREVWLVEYIIVIALLISHTEKYIHTKHTKITISKIYIKTKSVKLKVPRATLQRHLLLRARFLGEWRQIATRIPGDEVALLFLRDGAWRMRLLPRGEGSFA